MSLTVSAQVRQHVLPPQVFVTVTASPAVSDNLAIYRVHPDGSQSRVLTEVKTIATTATVVDFHCPFNRWITYQARVGNQVAGSGKVYINSDMVWLQHASDSDLSMMVPMVLGPPDDYTYEARTQSFEILNRSRAVVRAVNKRGAEKGTLTIRLDTPQQRSKLKALLADGMPILLNTPWSDDDFGWKWIAVDSLTISNPYGHLGYPHRQIKLPYIETSQPDVDVDPRWTIGDVARTFSTVGQVAAAYSNVRNMAYDIRS